jgi:dTMP kinase
MPKFAVIEGIDGVGKSTLRSGVYKAMDWNSLACCYMPGSTYIGSIISRLVKAPIAGNLPIPKASLYLFLANMEQAIEDLIDPALARGQHVLSDRWWPSTYAYQGVDINRQLILDLSLSMRTQPDVYIRVYTSREEREKRVGKRGADHIESKGEDFYKTVESNYMELESLLPLILPNTEVHLIESKDIEEMVSEVVELLGD